MYYMSVNSFPRVFWDRARRETKKLVIESGITVEWVNPYQVSIKTEATAFLGAHWPLNAHSAPRKAVDLGILFQGIFSFRYFPKISKLKKQLSSDNRSPNDRFKRESGNDERSHPGVPIQGRHLHNEPMKLKAPLHMSTTLPCPSNYIFFVTSYTCIH